MPQIEPFRALRYDLTRVGDLSTVLCPPYDVISASEQQRLMGLSPFNIVRVELGQDLAGDSDERNRYTRAAESLVAWQHEGALVQDARPAYYLVAHTYRASGREHTRRGIFAGVRLQPWSAGLVKPHEETFSGPKEDRYRLLSRTKVNVSPVFTIYRHQPAALVQAWAQCDDRAPDAELTLNGEHQRLWVVDAPELVAAIRDEFADEPQYIADGHHRFETALRYRDELEGSGELPDAHPARFVMAYIVHGDDAGLIVMPTHRLVRGIDLGRLAAVIDQLGDGVTRHEVPVGPAPTPDDLERLIAPLGTHGSTTSFGMLTGDGATMTVLTVSNPAVMQAAAPDRPESWRTLDVAVLQTLILDRLLPTHHERDASITYSRDSVESVQAVRRGDCQVTFLMGSPTVEQMATVADAGSRMPEKSTYFYPKVPTGLVMRRLD